MGSLPLAPSGKPYCIFSSAQLLSRVRLFVTPWTAAHQASLSITNSRSLPKLMSIELVVPSNHLILCCPLLLLLPIVIVTTVDLGISLGRKQGWSLVRVFSCEVV